MYRTDFWSLWEKARVGCFERTASKYVHYLGWNRSPAQAGCMRQVLGPGALGRPRGIGWRGRWEGGSGWGIHVNTWLIHVNVWQKTLQCCKVISLQLIKINEKKKKEEPIGKICRGPPNTLAKSIVVDSSTCQIPPFGTQALTLWDSHRIFIAISSCFFCPTTDNRKDTPKLLKCSCFY